MSSDKSQPPRLAIWCLRHAAPGRHNDALTGDLIEQFRDGRTHGWFWRQVFIAVTISILREIWSHWPHFGYAIVGTALSWFFWDAPALRRVPAWLHWNELPWPWSQIALELSRPGHPNYRQLVIPVELVLLLSFLTFLVAAWLGCRLPSQRRSANARPAL